MPSDTWVTVRTFDTQPMAELARVTLLNAEIPCRILNAEVVSMDWLLGNAVGFIPLQVPQDQLEAADRALGGEASADDRHSGDCPKCGEPLDSDGPCPMCGHVAESNNESPQLSEESSSDRERFADDNEPQPMLLDRMRGFGRSAISVYLGFVLVYFVLGALALLYLVSGSFH